MPTISPPRINDSFFGTFGNKNIFDSNLFVEDEWWPGRLAIYQEGTVHPLCIDEKYYGHIAADGSVEQENFEIYPGLETGDNPFQIVSDDDTAGIFEENLAGFIAATSQVFSPSVSGTFDTISPALLASTLSIPLHNIGPRVAVGALAATSALFSPSVGVPATGPSRYPIIITCT